MSAVPQKKIHPLLARYLTQLALHPLRTKCFTSGSLAFLQEILGSHLAGVPVAHSKGSSAVTRTFAGAHVNLKAFKMALYGFLVSAPISHVLVTQLQAAFAGKTSPAAKIGQLLANNFIVAPIQTTAFLSSMAVINGATSFGEIINTVRTGFFSVIKISWVVSPVSMVIAQKYLPVELWVPFFNGIQFVLGTYFNYKVKAMRLAAAKKEKDREGGPSQ